MAEDTGIRRVVRWVIPAAVVLVVVVALALRAVNASGAETNRYATATVTRGTVTETYAGSGSVTEVKQGSATFPAAGTVTKVNVAVGDKVEAGDPLASIDNTDLQIAVITAKQTLAEAEVTLEQAHDAATAAASASAGPIAGASPSASTAARNQQPATGTGGTSASASARPTASRPSTSQPSTSRPAPTSTATPTTTATPTSTASPTGGSTRPPTLAQLEAAVRHAQDELAAARLAATTELTAQQESCAALSTGGPTATPTGSTSETGTPSVTPTPSSTPSSTASPSASTTPTASSVATPSATATASPSASATLTPTATPVASVDPTTLAACIAAVVRSQEAQGHVAATQAELDPLVTALVAAATQNTGSQPGGGSSTGSGSGSGGSENGGGGGPADTGRAASGGASSPTGTRTGSSGGSPSTPAGQTGGQGQNAMTVGSADAAVTKAELALTTAEKALEGATMTAPISGTVGAVPFAKGETASTGDAVVIIGHGAVSVRMAVPEAAFRTLEVGQAATLTTPGGGQANGKVTQLGLLPTTSTTGTNTFPVTVIASGKGATTLPPGATATVSVQLSTSAEAIVAPVSAVTRTGTSGTVQLLQNGTVTRKTVTLGNLGSATVEVTEGLSPGDTLVIADNTVAMPTNSSNRGLRTGGAGFAAGGAPPGGAAPGGGGAPPGTR